MYCSDGSCGYKFSRGTGDSYVILDRKMMELYNTEWDTAALCAACVERVLECIFIVLNSMRYIVCLSVHMQDIICRRDSLEGLTHQERYPHLRANTTYSTSISKDSRNNPWKR